MLIFLRARTVPTTIL